MSGPLDLLLRRTLAMSDPLRSPVKRYTEPYYVGSLRPPAKKSLSYVRSLRPPAKKNLSYVGSPQISC